MEMTKPQKYETRVSEKYYLTDNEKYLLVKLELTEQNNTINFSAGQYVSVKVSEAGIRRSYSIASTPDIDHGVTLVTEIIPGGVGSEYIKNLTLGQTVEVLGPMGQFVIDDKIVTGENSAKLLYVATGSGITPIYAMINDLLINQKYQNQVRLHWGMRNESELFWFDNLGRLAEEHPNFVFDVVLSQPEPEWELCQGHVQDCLERDLGKKELESGWRAYVCGNPKMIENVTEALIKIGMPQEDIIFEKYN